MVQVLLAIIYLAFISLGLPDSVLGSAWPSMYVELDVPLSYAGIISMIISAGTVVSSLQSARLTKWMGTGLVTGISVALTAVSLLGFSMSHSYWMLCLWAIPYGLGAGSVDAALNNYVAVHYASRHMSWLHCMWGVGTIIGPYVMGYALTRGFSWNFGYRCIGIFQVVLAVILIVTLPLWKKQQTQTHEADNRATKALTLGEVFRLKGVPQIMVAFFCYSTVEATTMLWASSYMVLRNGISAETAAGYASMFFIGITVGRGINGFLTMKLSDAQMIRIGQGIILVGIAAMLIPAGNTVTIIGLIIVGLGCAPIYPCIIHSTPEHFGAENSQSVIGVQMASAYIGTTLMPPLFGVIANHISVKLLPLYLIAALILMFLMHEGLLRRTKSVK